jgi:molecular chaperone DnaK (HSP70)
MGTLLVLIHVFTHFIQAPQVLESEIGHSTPSYVTLTQLSSRVPYAWGLQHLDRVGRCVAVGELARRQMSRHLSDVVFNAKRLIGKRFDDPDIQKMRKGSVSALLKDQKENLG